MRRAFPRGGAGTQVALFTVPFILVLAGTLCFLLWHRLEATSVRYRFWHAESDDQRLDHLERLFILGAEDPGIAYGREAAYLARWGGEDVRDSAMQYLAFFVMSSRGGTRNPVEVTAQFDTDGNGAADLELTAERRNGVFSYSYEWDADREPRSRFHIVVW
jgi:hypothetical protein